MTVKERLHTAVETMSDEEAQAALRTFAESSGDWRVRFERND
jgi:hypothetical protein